VQLGPGASEILKNLEQTLAGLNAQSQLTLDPKQNFAAEKWAGAMGNSLYEAHWGDKRTPRLTKAISKAIMKRIPSFVQTSKS
jgi:hypothetical protein